VNHHREKRPDSIGAVIVFNPERIKDMTEATSFLDMLADKGYIKRTYPHTFDSCMGGPVWYIP
jgi:hypothetical protein